MAARENDSREDICNTWNETFLDLNMRISDLTHPTEVFLTKTFVHYLRAFGYKVDPPYNLDVDSSGDNSREKRIFLIKISRHIESILQISVKSRTFCYYDLIKPTPKKTLNILDILYNYLCYFNMYKKEVFAMATDGIKKHDALQAEAAELKRESEYRKKHAVELKTQKETLTMELAKLRPNLEKLGSNKREKQKELQVLKDKCEELKTQLSSLQAQNSQWESRIVTDEQIIELKAQNEKLNIETKMCKQQIKEHEVALQERKILIETNKALCEKIAEAREIITPKLINQLKENKKQYEYTNKVFKIEENKLNEIKDTIEDHQSQLKLLEQQLRERQNRHDQEKKAMQQIVEDKKNIVLDHSEELKTLKAAQSKVQQEFVVQEKLKEDLQQIMTSYLVKP